MEDVEHELTPAEEEEAGDEKGLIFAIKPSVAVIWTIIFLNVVISWITYFILWGVNVKRLNDERKSNVLVVVAKTIMIVQGILCLLANLLVISVVKKYKMAVIPLGVILLTVSIFSFILAGKLGKINKHARNGTLTDDIVNSAKGFSLFLAASYTGLVTLLIVYLWAFRPEVYSYAKARLEHALTAEKVDDDIEMDEGTNPGFVDSLFGGASSETKTLTSEERVAANLRKRQRAAELREKHLEQKNLIEETKHKAKLEMIERQTQDRIMASQRMAAQAAATASTADVLHHQQQLMNHATGSSSVYQPGGRIKLKGPVAGVKLAKNDISLDDVANVFGGGGSAEEPATATAPSGQPPAQLNFLQKKALLAKKGLGASLSSEDEANLALIQQEADMAKYDKEAADLIKALNTT